MEFYWKFGHLTGEMVEKNFGCLPLVELICRATSAAIGAHENALADRLRQGIAAAGYGFVCQTRTNQLFPVFPDALVERLEADFGFHRWGAAGEGRTAVRLVTSWSTQAADVEAFLRALA